jgi:hypothetical protein
MHMVRACDGIEGEAGVRAARGDIVAGERRLWGRQGPPGTAWRFELVCKTTNPGSKADAFVECGRKSRRRPSLVASHHMLLRALTRVPWQLPGSVLLCAAAPLVAEVWERDAPATAASSTSLGLDATAVAQLRDNGYVIGSAARAFGPLSIPPDQQPNN